MPRPRPSIVALSTIGLVAAVPALAQAIPEGQSCGGLLCDVGVFGHKVPAAPTPAAPPPPPLKSDQTAAIAPTPVVAPVPDADPPHKADPLAHKAPRKKRAAKNMAKSTVKSAAPRVGSVKAKPAANGTANPAAATPPPGGSAGSASTGEAPPSPANMFQPIYR